MRSAASSAPRVPSKTTSPRTCHHRQKGNCCPFTGVISCLVCLQTVAHLLVIKSALIPRTWAATCRSPLWKVFCLLPASELHLNYAWLGKGCFACLKPCFRPSIVCRCSAWVCSLALFKVLVQMYPCITSRPQELNTVTTTRSTHGPAWPWHCRVHAVGPLTTIWAHQGILPAGLGSV